MRKIFLSTIVLTAFAFSIALFQLSCKKDVIAQVASYVLPIASATKLGGVMVDGSSITIDKDGKISAVAGVALYPLEIASTTKLGGVMVDGSSVIVSEEGIISAVETDYAEIVYCKENGLNDEPEFWKVTVDKGTNQRIPVVLPSGLVIEPFSIGYKRSKNKITFGARSTNNKEINYIFTCKLDGSEVTKILEVNDDIVL